MSCVVGKALLIYGHMGLDCCGVPWLAMFRWNPKCWLEMDIDARKVNGVFPKIQSGPNIPPAKTEWLSNNNDNNKTSESTGSVITGDYSYGWDQQVSNWNTF